MRSRYTIPPWKTSPFIRMVPPLFAGVLLQWYFDFDLTILLICAALVSAAYAVMLFFSLGKKYRFRIIQGILLQSIICILGLLLTWNTDIRNHKAWFGHYVTDSSLFAVTIAEPLVKKDKSFKANAFVTHIIQDNRKLRVTGKLIVYFIDTSNIVYGDRILIGKSLQPIKNTGNPAAFDYARYAAFQQQFHTVFLKHGDYVLLKDRDVNSFKDFIFNSRAYIIKTLKTYVSKEKSIGGIAEALLIGYKQDLDKELMQAYGNTGVVHIIAISGLHLGLIYVMLTWLMQVLPVVKRYATIKVLVILISLWLFSILTGSSASVLRSALMFTCILIGKTYFKQSTVYNSIAASAFMLVCYDPYLLWDVGFQLSYLAVIGIVWLQRPISNLIYIKNKWLHKVWSMVAVTLAAQIAAFPLCLFYFHQFPNLFLITNIVAVPLSTIILFAEIFLICFSWLDVAAIYAGRLIFFLIDLMNQVIVFCNGLPWSVSDNIYATVLTTLALYGMVLATCAWLIDRHKHYVYVVLSCLLVFTSMHLYADIISLKQKKIIVYNVSKMQAIDFIQGNAYYFLGDTTLRQAGLSQNFHVRPARIHFQASQPKDPRLVYNEHTGMALFCGKRIFLAQRPLHFDSLANKVAVEILVISRNPSLKIAGLVTALKPTMVVFDASNSLWKIAQWKKECSALLLPFHSVPEQGAFISDIN